MFSAGTTGATSFHPAPQAPEKNKSIFPRRLSVLSGLLILAVAGCSEEIMVGEVPNRPPDTRISSGTPQAHESTSYRVHLNWLGEDEDGQIAGYYHAWDDTLDAEGQPAWQWTSAADSTFLVSADSCLASPCGDGGPLFFDYHTFWVKAVDDDGAHDPTPAYRTLTATTVAPEAVITLGPRTICPGLCVTCSPYVYVEWEGHDPDGQVAGYWYKWNARLREHPTSRGPDPAVQGWTFLPAESTRVTSYEEQLSPGCNERANSFSVFAVDDAGAVQQVGTCGKNWLCFCPVEEKGGPGLCLNGGELGIRSSDGMGCDVTDGGSYPPRSLSLYSFEALSQAFVGTPVRFSWTALESPEVPPQPLEGFRYAVDDPTDWSPLGRETMWPDSSEAAWMPEPGYHEFYLQAFYSSGLCDSGSFKFHICEGPGGAARRILLVDDTGEDDVSYTEWSRFSDREESAFFEDMLGGYVYDEWDNMIRGKAPTPIPLAEYSTLIWGVGNRTRGWASWLLRLLFSDGAEYLSSYVRTGGNVMIVGMNPMFSMMTRHCSGQGELTDVCGNPPAKGEWMYFDPSLCGLEEGEGYAHFLFTRLGIRRMMVPLAPADGIYQLARDRVVKGAVPGDGEGLFSRYLAVDSLKAGGPLDPYPGGVDWIPAANVACAAELEDWVTPLYHLDAADPTIPTDLVLAICADGNLNPRRAPGDGDWGKVVFLGIHPFFLVDDDARWFFERVLSDVFGE